MKRYKIMIAGAANPHIPQYLRGCAPAGSNRQLVAVSDPDPQRLAAARNIVGAGADAVAWHDDYHAMLDAHADADIVIIGSDNRDHFAMFCEAVRRKLHIFTMKVISMDEDECREMLAMQARYDRVIGTELELHFLPQFIQARDMVRADVIGELQSVLDEYLAESLQLLSQLGSAGIVLRKAGALASGRDGLSRRRHHRPPTSLRSDPLDKRAGISQRESDVGDQSAGGVGG